MAGYAVYPQRVHDYQVSHSFDVTLLAVRSPEADVQNSREQRPTGRTQTCKLLTELIAQTFKWWPGIVFSAISGR
jgi:hypothetical protein